MATHAPHPSALPRSVAEVVAEVSIDSPEGGLVDREKVDRAVTLLVRSGLVEGDGKALRLTAEGHGFWRRISHLQTSGMKKWIREAIDAYSRGEETRWAISDEAWSDAQVIYLEVQRLRMTARLEVLEGYLKALENWHFVSTLLGTAADRSAALAALRGFPLRLTEAQATHVIDMRLSQRTALGRLSLAEERDAIRAELHELVREETLPESKESQSGNPEGWSASVQDLRWLAEQGKSFAETMRSEASSKPSKRY